MENDFVPGDYGSILLGTIYVNKYNQQFEVINVRKPKDDEYKYNTIEYNIKCLECYEVKKIIQQQIKQKTAVCLDCHRAKRDTIKELRKEQDKKRNKKKQTKQEMIDEINNIFQYMVKLEKEGKLEEYILNKYMYTREYLQTNDLIYD